MYKGSLVGVCVMWLASLSASAQGTPALLNLHENVRGVSSPVGLPDAPSAIEPAAAAKDQDGTHETLASDPYRPLTMHQKWQHFLSRTHASPTFVSAGEDTVFTRATGGFIYCCGIGSWGEQYAATLADGESRQFFGNFLFPTLLRQDPRYFPKRRGTVLGRAWYAATRLIVTRNDNGHECFNASEMLGVAFSKALSNAYYPERRRGGWDTASNILGTYQSDVSGNLLREFWPDIRRIVHKHTPKSLRGLEATLPLTDPSAQY